MHQPSLRQFVSAVVTFADLGGQTGSAAQALGGPFDQYGAIGSQFSQEGPAGTTSELRARSGLHATPVLIKEVRCHAGNAAKQVGETLSSAGSK